MIYQETLRDLKLTPDLKYYLKTQAIASIPLSKKQAYLEVLQKAPNLPEADPLAWVRRWDYNIWKAAEAFVAYWEERKDVFGQDRFYLPLDLSGNGALEEKEIKQIMAGFPAVISDNSTGEKYGVFDRRNMLSTSGTNVLLRAIFYVTSILAEDERAQAEGLKSMYVLASHLEYPINKEYSQRALDIFSTVIPIKARWLMLVDLTKPALDAILSQQCIACFTSWFSESDVKVFSHTQTIEEQHQTLFEEGFSNECIPVIFGGQWTLENSTAWIVEHDLQRQRDYNVRLLTNQRTGMFPNEARLFADNSVYLAMPAVTQMQALSTQIGGSQQPSGNSMPAGSGSIASFLPASLSNDRHLENFAKVSAEPTLDQFQIKVHLSHHVSILSCRQCRQYPAKRRWFT